MTLELRHLRQMRSVKVNTFREMKTIKLSPICFAIYDI